MNVTGYNFKGYDIGKLLLETMYERQETNPSYTFNEANFPSKDDIYDFIGFYLLAYNYNGENKNLLQINLKNDLSIHEQEYNLSISQNEKDELYEEIIVGMMISGYYWTVIGIKLGTYPI